MNSGDNQQNNAPMQTPQVIIQDEDQSPSEIDSREDSMGSQQNSQDWNNGHSVPDSKFGVALIPLAQKTTQTAQNAVKHESAAITNTMHKQQKAEQAEQLSAAECYMDPGDDMVTPGGLNKIGAKVISHKKDDGKVSNKKTDEIVISTETSNNSRNSDLSDIKGIMAKQNEMGEKDSDKKDDKKGKNKEEERTRSKGLDEFLAMGGSDDSDDGKMEVGTANVRRRAFAKDSKNGRNSERRGSDSTPNLFDDKSETRNQQVQNNGDWVS